MQNDFVFKGRSVSDLKVHLALVTKHRRKVFTAEMLARENFSRAFIPRS